MTLHDKGKALLQKGDTKQALDILVAADEKGFSRCKDKGILDKIDNYGLLCLDIAWTMFKLKDLSNLKGIISSWLRTTTIK